MPLLVCWASPQLKKDGGLKKAFIQIDQSTFLIEDICHLSPKGSVSRWDQSRVRQGVFVTETHREDIARVFYQVRTLVKIKKKKINW